MKSLIVVLTAAACALLPAYAAAGTLDQQQTAERKPMRTSPATKPTKPAKMTCQAENVRSGAKSTALQPLINAALAGDTIQVKGVCVGASVVERDLTLTGKASKSIPVPTLNGGAQGSVIHLKGAALEVRDLRVTNGIGTPDPTLGGRYGGGIESWGGDVTLSGTTNVTGNTAESAGGGVDFFNGIDPYTASSDFVLKNAARVAGNSSAAGREDVNQDDSGGVWSLDSGELGIATTTGPDVTASGTDVDTLDVQGGETEVSDGDFGELTTRGATTISGGTIDSLVLQGQHPDMDLTGGDIGTVAFDGIVEVDGATIGSMDGAGQIDVLSGDVDEAHVIPGPIQLPGGIIFETEGYLTVYGGHVDQIDADSGGKVWVRDAGTAGTITRDGPCPVIVSDGGHVDKIEIVSGPTGEDANVLIFGGEADIVDDYVCGGGLDLETDMGAIGQYNFLATGCS